MSNRTLTGSRIRGRRLDLGLKQSELANEVGISPSYLNLIEHNRRRIAGKLLVDLARVLKVDVSSLSEGAEATMMVDLRDAASDQSTPPVELDRVEEFAGRFPGWATLLVAGHRRVKELERTVETLSDRLTHDPFLSASLHEVLSTVTAIRSTSSILAEPGEIEPSWQRRFQTNIHEDALRLAESVEGLVTYLDAAGDAERELTSPQEELEVWLEGRDYHVAELEGAKTQSPEQLIEDDVKLTLSARALILAYLQTYRADADALPLASFQAAAAEMHYDPARLATYFGVGLDIVFRRLATLPSKAEHLRIGRVACDASGTLTFRKPTTGFDVPRFGAVCALWPLYGALAQPMAPIRTIVEQVGRNPRQFLTYALSQPRYPDGFDGVAVYEVQMLVLPIDLLAETGINTVRSVGTSCRICPKIECVARREPSILSDGF
ncbi:helix-turn-helix transcriptional regulator [Pseudohalocynthiibacter sp. F2068]|jgi:XRE family transcriptional regulator, fatty acid utilization regulator|uniref:helix-turn-helix transcriptional regulator n=1 Tax=Pseudohalocynthiibacter sp. F2068 TaxID=2926418 RepID=UPI001FF2F51F|nr:helix-turn-helix transcriptional regulator [Pseudohalocynthiibacter sp. F2068]MCK0101951.1 helix-turn-helix domain-containing protein [Pseudohalocynthiibacter sp. F2068]